jgi:hypothetical protein
LYVFLSRLSPFDIVASSRSKTRMLKTVPVIHSFIFQTWFLLHAVVLPFVHQNRVRRCYLRLCFTKHTL